MMPRSPQVDWPRHGTATCPSPRVWSLAPARGRSGRNTPVIETARLVAGYSKRFNACHVQDHTVASALGLWLLLALVAPAVEGPARERLERELGTDADDAAQRAGTLLSKPHPAVRAAAAVWARSDLVGPAFGSWAGSLPYVIDRGEMPGQSQADRWAALHTDGLIRNFPLKLDEFTAVVLAQCAGDGRVVVQAVCCCSWFRVGWRVRGVDHHGTPCPAWPCAMHRRHRRRRLVGVHAADTDEGLRVISVIAAREVTPDVVHLAASQVAVGPRQAPRGREGDRLVRPAVG